VGFLPLGRQASTPACRQAGLPTDRQACPLVEK